MAWKCGDGVFVLERRARLFASDSKAMVDPVARPRLFLTPACREVMMLNRCVIGSLAFAAAASIMAYGQAQTPDMSKYPDWRGAWARVVVRGMTGQPSFDQTKPWGFGQQAPLTPEYQ